MRPGPGLAVAVLLLGAATACGTSQPHEADTGSTVDEAVVDGADRAVCRADAQAVPDATADLPTGWSFPAATTAYGIEHRDGVGTIVTAVTSTPFDEVLDHLNHAEQGVHITDGETEEDDAEANWSADGYTGRWTIRKSPTCAGETVIQVLSTPAG